MGILAVGCQPTIGNGAAWWGFGCRFFETRSAGSRSQYELLSNGNREDIPKTTDTRYNQVATAWVGKMSKKD